MPISIRGSEARDASGKHTDTGLSSHKEAVRAAKERGSAASKGRTSVAVADTLMAWVALDFDGAQRFEWVETEDEARERAIEAALAQGKPAAEIARIAQGPVEPLKRLALLKQMERAAEVDGQSLKAGDWYGRWEDTGKVFTVGAESHKARFQRVNRAEPKKE